MVSIEQIAILEQKVEGAVAKIAQLTAENDALRSKCVELTNALSAKTEQLSAFQTDQNKIEVGIMKALEQLRSLEGIKTASSEMTNNAPNEETAPKSDAPTEVQEPPAEPSLEESKTQESSEANFETNNENTIEENESSETTEDNQSTEQSSQTEDSVTEQTVPSDSENETEEPSLSDDAETDTPQDSKAIFDIF